MAVKEIVVQKYGGTSVADPEKMRVVAEHVKQTTEKKRVVVVVSAMGQETDRLVRMAQEVYGGPPPRDELDNLLVTGEEQAASLLALAIRRLGLAATSLTGREIKLEANSTGKIKRVQDVERIKILLNKGEVVVVTGFQGIIEGQDKVVTLGRGGSDLTSISLAAALGENYCENYTDVDGIFTVDPRFVPKAKRFDHLGYYQLTQMAELGGGKLMHRAVDLAQKLGVKIRVLLSPSFGESTGGTLVSAGGDLEQMETPWIQSGIAIQKGMLVRISNVANEPGASWKIFGSLEDFVLMDSVQGRGETTADISLLCFSEDLSQILTRLNEVGETETVGEIKISEGMAAGELTLVNPLMTEERRYYARVFGAMAKVGVNVEMYGAAGSAISVVVKEDDLKTAAQALAEEFDLISE